MFLLWFAFPKSRAQFKIASLFSIAISKHICCAFVSHFLVYEDHKYTSKVRRPQVY